MTEGAPQLPEPPAAAQPDDAEAAAAAADKDAAEAGAAAADKDPAEAASAQDGEDDGPAHTTAEAPVHSPGEPAFDPPFARPRPPFIFLQDALILIVGGGALGALGYGYLQAITEATSAWMQADGNSGYPSDPSTLGFGAGRPWWVGIMAAAGLAVGLSKALLRLDTAPTFIDELRSMHADPVASLKVGAVALLGLIGGVPMGCVPRAARRQQPGVAPADGIAELPPVPAAAAHAHTPSTPRRPEAGLGALAGSAGVVVGTRVRTLRLQAGPRRRLYVLGAMCALFSAMLPNPLTAVLLCLELGRPMGLARDFSFMGLVVLLGSGATSAFVVFYAIAGCAGVGCGEGGSRVLGQGGARPCMLQLRADSLAPASLAPRLLPSLFPCRRYPYLSPITTAASVESIIKYNQLGCAGGRAAVLHGVSQLQLRREAAAGRWPACLPVSAPTGPRLVCLCACPRSIVEGLLFGCMGAALAGAYILVAGLVKAAVGPLRAALDARFGRWPRIVVLAALGGTATGLLGWAMPLVITDGSQQLDAVMTQGAQIGSGVLAASCFARMLTYHVCAETGFHGGYHRWAGWEAALRERGFWVRGSMACSAAVCPPPLPPPHHPPPTQTQEASSSRCCPPAPCWAPYS